MSTYNPSTALEALLNGDFDNPHLVSYGYLHADQSIDVANLQTQIKSLKNEHN